MIVDSNKFPFKWMPGILLALERNESIRTFRISREIGSCVIDGSESVQMLSYLTSFGKMELNGEKWNLVYGTDKNSDPKNFRFRYIADLDKILHLLKKEPLSTYEIATVISKDENEVTSALEFLTLITKKGKVESDGSGRNRKWRIKKWPN